VAEPVVVLFVRAPPLGPEGAAACFAQVWDQPPEDAPPGARLAASVEQARSAARARGGPDPFPDGA
jgi:hypothetical protein